MIDPATIRYCPRCAGSIELRVPAGDVRARHVCSVCAEVQYQNPLVVVGSVPIWEERVLLCRRAIEPRRGFWTLPAGFLELGETAAAGARREAREEAHAEIETGRLLAVYDLLHVGQVQLYYAARLRSPEVRAGEESLEVGLFAWDELPRQELAFPTVGWVLDYWREVRDQPDFAPDTRARVAPSERS